MVEKISVHRLRPYVLNPRIHDQKQIEALKASIQEFGFVSPVIIDEYDMILVGHGRVKAAEALGIEEVPCVVAKGLTDEQKKAYIIADNLLTEKGGWDFSLIESELSEIKDIDMTNFGFAELIQDEEEESEDEKPQIKPLICPKCGFEFTEG